MKNFILLTEDFSGEKILINLDKVIYMRSTKGGAGTEITYNQGMGSDTHWVSETIEEIYEIINKPI